MKKRKRQNIYFILTEINKRINDLIFPIFLISNLNYKRFFFRSLCIILMDLNKGYIW